MDLEIEWQRGRQNWLRVLRIARFRTRRTVEM